ncbi:MAG: nuclear transport factor 2 family protein [Thermoleophilia bacterium]
MVAHDLEQELAGLYRRWFAALAARDRTFFEQTLADDWYYVDIVGTVRDRDAYREMVDLVPPDLKLEMVGFELREKGDVVLVRGTYLVEAVLLDGRDVGSETQFTAAWERGPDGRLRCLLHHATRTETA